VISKGVAQQLQLDMRMPTNARIKDRKKPPKNQDLPISEATPPSQPNTLSTQPDSIHPLTTPGQTHNNPHAQLSRPCAPKSSKTST
jgi:hypothetical protein